MVKEKIAQSGFKKKLVAVELDPVRVARAKEIIEDTPLTFAAFVRGAIDREIARLEKDQEKKAIRRAVA